MVMGGRLFAVEFARAAESLGFGGRRAFSACVVSWLIR